MNSGVYLNSFSEQLHQLAETLFELNNTIS